MKRRQISIFAFLLVFLLSASCTMQYDIVAEPMDIRPNSLPLTVELALSPDICNYSHVGSCIKFKMGSSLCSYLEKTVKSVFSEVYVDSHVKNRTNVDLIIIPKLVDTFYNLDNSSLPAKVNTRIVIEWEIRDTNMNLITTERIAGVGLDTRLLGLLDVRVEKSFEGALDDLFNKSRTYLMSLQEIRQLVKM